MAATVITELGLFLHVYETKGLENRNVICKDGHPNSICFRRDRGKFVQGERGHKDLMYLVYVHACCVST